MSIISCHEVRKYLPHRYPFLMIDRVLEFTEYESLVALKNVTVNEPFFTGHFPQQAVMPGVLIVEALAQAAGILAYKSTSSSPDKELFFLASVDNVRYKKMVEPGDQLILKVKVLGSKRDFWKVQGEAFVDDELVCSAQIMSAKRKVVND